MKKIFLLFSICLAMLGCEKDAGSPELTSAASPTNSAEGAWERKADIPILQNSENTGFAFIINNKAYLGIQNIERNYFGEYDQANNVWEQKADFRHSPGMTQGVGFSIGSMGYFGTGKLIAPRGPYPSAQFYQYNPASNSWVQKANVPIGLLSTVGFSIGSKGYIGTGLSDRPNPDPNGFSIYFSVKNFYEYDPETDKWTRKADFPAERSGATGFSIANRGYIGTGREVIKQGTEFVNQNKNDFWEYNPDSDCWTRKADFPGGERYDAAGLSIGSYGYLGLGTIKVGEFPDQMPKDFWEYCPSTNLWTRKQDFPENGRARPIAFGLNQKGYIGGGDASYNRQLHDLWQFDPSK